MGTPAFVVTGDLTFDGITYETALASVDVFVAAVADAASSERINVTLPRGVMDDLKRHALEEGRSCGNLAAFLVEDALRRHRPLS